LGGIAAEIATHRNVVQPIRSGDAFRARLADTRPHARSEDLMADTASPLATSPLAASPLATIPFVDYLVLDDGEPHLVANECTSCRARFFDRRNACAGCFGTEFRRVNVATQGVVRAFTIVAFAAPGVAVPYTAGLVELDGTSARGNIINCPADPEHVTLGMRVRLATYSMGADEAGTEAINFGFEPIGEQQ